MTRLYSFVSLIILIPSLLFFAGPVSAAPSSATATIESAVNTIMEIVKDPGMKDPAIRQELLHKVENIAQTIFDFEEFSARTVGPNWRKFTDDQKKRFIDAFASLLRASYLDKVEGYNGEKVNYIAEVSSTKGDKVEVQTTVQIQDKLVPVAYRMILKNGRWMVYDVLIERVSLVENYRGQFKELLAKGDAEMLIVKVETKAKEVRQQNKTGKG